MQVDEHNFPANSVGQWCARVPTAVNSYMRYEGRKIELPVLTWVPIVRAVKHIIWTAAVDSDNFSFINSSI